MNISPFFLDLRSAYQSELEDLTFDSEGRDVLRQRLADKRREIGFLVQMMELSPEMVAVVFHKAFKFTAPAVMDDLLGHEADELPEWSSVADVVQLAPWARDLADVFLQEPRGDWFLTLAAGLEYMAGKPVAAGASRDEDDEDEDGDDADEFDVDDNGEEQGDGQARKEAADDWMVEQGFDRKD